MNNAIDHINTLDTELSEFIIQLNDRYNYSSHKMEMISNSQTSNLHNAVNESLATMLQSETFVKMASDAAKKAMTNSRQLELEMQLLVILK